MNKWRAQMFTSPPVTFPSAPRAPPSLGRWHLSWAEPPVPSVHLQRHGCAPRELQGPAEFQLWFLAQPTVLEKNFNAALGTAQSWCRCGADGIRLAQLGSAVTSAQDHGGTNCSKIQGDAVTKPVLLLYFTAQGASIKILQCCGLLSLHAFFPPY